VTPKLLRYLDLAGAVDADPIATQPARDAYGPLTAGLGQRVSIDALVVDADGAVMAPGALTVDIAVAWVYQVAVDREPPTATQASNDAWARGPIARAVIPGEELTQAELGDVVGFTAVVVGKSASPAGLRLAIFATLGPAT